MDWTYGDNEDELITWIDGSGWGLSGSLALLATIPWVDDEVEHGADASHLLTDAQRAVADYIVTEANAIFARSISALRESLGPVFEDADDDEDEDEDEAYDELDDDEDEYQDPEFSALFDDPDELDDDDFEEGYEEEQKSLVDQMQLTGVRIRRPVEGEPAEFVVYGNAEWDPEHGFAVVFNGAKLVEVGQLDLAYH